MAQSNSKTTTLHRRADNGLFCTEEYAKNHPNTTVTETVVKPKTSQQSPAKKKGK